MDNIKLSFLFRSVCTRSGEYFAGGEAGMAIPGAACSAMSVGISVDINAYEPHVLAGSMAHMIGHNVGMSHDDKSKYLLLLNRYKDNVVTLADIGNGPKSFETRGGVSSRKRP